MATELPSPSPTGDVASEPVDTLDAGAVTEAAPAVPLAQVIGTPRQDKPGDVRCDRCGLWFPESALIVDRLTLANLCANCNAVLTKLSEPVLIDGAAPTLVVTELYAVILIDRKTGDETVGALSMGRFDMPLVSASEQRLRALVETVRTMADNQGVNFRVKRLSVVEDVTDRATNATV